MIYKLLGGNNIDIFIGANNIFFDALVSGATGVIAIGLRSPQLLLGEFH